MLSVLYCTVAPPPLLLLLLLVIDFTCSEQSAAVVSLAVG